MHAWLLSCVWLFVTPWTVAQQAPLSIGFPGKNIGASCYFLLQGIFPTQGSNPCLCVSCTGRLMLYRWVTWEAHLSIYKHTETHTHTDTHTHRHTQTHRDTHRYTHTHTHDSEEPTWLGHEWTVSRTFSQGERQGLLSMKTTERENDTETRENLELPLEVHV